MLWRPTPHDPAPRSEQFRRVHERWLNRALTAAQPIPRIPLRRADRGGFDRLLNRPGGRQLAERWWSLAMALSDLDD
jgi:hypothetical protein